MADEKVTIHKMGYITFLPGVKTSVLKKYRDKGKIGILNYDRVKKGVREGYEVTVDHRGHLQVVRNPVNGHVMGRYIERDLTEEFPETNPAMDKPFEVKDPTTYTNIRHVTTDGTVYFEFDEGHIDGTGGKMELKDLTPDQMKLAGIHVEAEIGVDTARYEKMLALLNEDKFDEAKTYMDSNDGEAFSGDEPLTKENLKSHVEYMITESKRYDKALKGTLDLFEAELERRKVPDKKTGYDYRDRPDLMDAVETVSEYIFRWIGGRIVRFKPKYNPKYDKKK